MIYSVCQPSLGAGVMQGNNEPSGRGGAAAVGDAARQEHRTQGLNICPAQHPHKPLDDLLTSSPPTDNDGFPAV